jgi:TPR repeat protein
MFGNKKSSFENRVIREQILQYIESNNVNFRQDLLLPLKKNINAPEMSQLLVSLINEFSKKDSNNVTNLFLLGFFYRAKRDFSTALSYFDRAIEMGDANAMFVKGYMYTTGNEVLQDKAKADENYRMAVLLNHAQAMFNLANLIIENPNLARNSTEVESLFFKAAQLGYKPAEEIFDHIKRTSYFVHCSFINKNVEQRIDLDAVQYEMNCGALIGLSSGEQGQLVEDFVSVTYNLQLPSIFNTFDSETNYKFETTLREKIAAMYSEHMHEYRKLFEISPFKAECLKMKFSENMHGIVQKRANEVIEHLAENQQRFGCNF